MSYRRDLVYIYDGSFEGLLTAVFDSYKNREIPCEITDSNSLQEDFLCEYKNIVTDREKSERVSLAIEKKVSKEALENIYLTYLSDTPNKGRLCLDYIRAGLKFGKKVDINLTLDCVMKITDAVRKIKNEAFRYLEFVRFSELDGGIFYSEIEPFCNVLPLIAPHFEKRLSNMPWIIHDTKRQLCMVYNGKYCCLTPTDTAPRLKFSKSETEYRRLWKNFYDSIAITERYNEKRRMGHMPKRYWNHLTELM